VSATTPIADWARSAPCSTGSSNPTPLRTSSRLTSTPLSDADAHAPRRDDSAETSAERRRNTRLARSASTAERALSTPSATPGQFEQWL